MKTLNGKRAVITGGAVGIGEGIARSLAERGADVAICDIQHEKATNAASSIAEDTGQACHFIPADVRDADQVKAFIDSAAESLGGIDILVANAGVWRNTDAREDSYDKAVDDYSHVVDVNLRGLFLTGRAAIPYLIDGGGDIVHIATDHICPPPGSPTGGGTTMDLYDASKWAINGLTQNWARRLGEDGVRVNAVCMDAVDSEMTRGALAELFDEEAFEQLVSSELVNMWLKPPDIGEVVAAILEEGPDGRTGENVGVWIGHPRTLPEATPLEESRFP